MFTAGFTAKYSRKNILIAVGLLAMAAMLLFGPQGKGASAQEDKLIRVGLATKANSVTLSTTGDYQLVDLSSGQVIRDINYGRTVQVSPDAGSGQYMVAAGGVSSLPASFAVLGADAVTGQLSREAIVMAGDTGAPSVVKGMSVTVDSTPVGTFAGPVLVRETNTSAVNTCTLGSNRYRGNMEFRLDNNNTLTAINELSLEKYLYGVVPSEMPSSWGAEALKAQAVAARNYALRQRGSLRFSGQGYDVVATDLSQVYRGYTGEKATTTEAIDATKGVVMLADGKPIDAVYHSSSGGATENSEEVWTYPSSYLKTKPDPLDLNALHYNWQYPTSGEMSMSQVAAKLKAYKGWSFGTITNVVAEQMTSSGNRIMVLRIEGKDTAGNPLTQRLSKADSVRSAFGLKSGPREVVVNLGLDLLPTGIIFKGSGWGHGLGMSQWGAKGMAEAGNEYRSILQYYYTGVTIADNYGE